MSDNELEFCDSVEVHTELLRVVTEQMPREEELYDLAELFKVFGDSTRIRILYVLFEAEVCVCDIAEALGMTQPAISHQLRILRDNHVIKSRRDGQNIVYALADAHILAVLELALAHIGCKEGL